MINMIVAVSKNGVIGKNGNLPWRIPEDLKAFKELTMGGTLFVGKNTAATLPPLKGRTVVKVNRTEFPTLNDVTDPQWGDTSRWIIGGAAIYNAALDADIVDKVYLTVIDQDFDGDTFFSHGQFQDPKWILTGTRVLKETDPLVTLQEWTRKRV